MSLLSSFSKKQPEATSVEDALAGTMSHSSAKSRSRKFDKHSADAELIPEKKRARRRLIGALIIVLVVAIGLPMVLDSEPQALNKSIAIQISDRDESTVAPDVNEKVVQSGSIEPSSNTASLPSVTSVPVMEKKDARFQSGKGSAKESTNKTDEEPVKESVSSTGSNSIAKAETEKEAKTKNEAKAAAAARVVLQVGAFASQEKVNEVRSKLSSAGINSFTQKVATSSGEKIRVRVGPFSDKESADKVKTKLKKLGINASLMSN